MLRLSNERLMAVLVDSSDVRVVVEEGVSSESAANVYSCNSGPPADDDSSDTSLKLGSVVLFFLSHFNNNYYKNYGLAISNHIKFYSIVS